VLQAVFFGAAVDVDTHSPRHLPAQILPKSVLKASRYRLELRLDAAK